ncbi:MAG: hypothetical protein EBU90_21720 [Proteobacteria bacterium]|nr:hypothetical protein [Pseudomonadota bacterium]
MASNKKKIKAPDYYMSMPTIQLDNGWIIKSSIWPMSHSFFLIHSRYTKQTIVRFFPDSKDYEAYAFIDKITSRSAKEIFPDKAYTSFDEENED